MELLFKEEVIQTMGTDGPTSIGQLIEALDFYKISHAEKNTRVSKKNPVPYKYSILTVIRMLIIHIGHCYMKQNITTPN